MRGTLSITPRHNIFLVQHNNTLHYIMQGAAQEHEGCHGDPGMVYIKGKSGGGLSKILLILKGIQQENQTCPAPSQHIKIQVIVCL